MASYRSILPCTQLAAGVMTGTSVINSTPMDILSIPNACYEISWTGTPTGVLSIQISNTQTVWSALDMDLTQPAGSASGFVVNMSGLAARYIRVSYTNASSTGALTVIGSAKT